MKKDENAPLDYFKDILLQGYVDIVCVSESKLHNCNVHKEVDCSPTFKYYRKDRTSNSGGVIALIRSDIPHYRLPDLEFDSYEDHIESIVFELKIKKIHGILFSLTNILKRQINYSLIS